MAYVEIKDGLKINPELMEAVDMEVRLGQYYTVICYGQKETYRSRTMQDKDVAESMLEQIANGMDKDFVPAWYEHG